MKAATTVGPAGLPARTGPKGFERVFSFWLEGKFSGKMGRALEERHQNNCHLKKNDRYTRSILDEVDDNLKPCQGTPKWPQKRGSLRA